MTIKVFVKLLLCILVSTILSWFFPYTGSKVIDYYVIINIVITLFSVSLAIVALMITILDKYKEKVTDQKSWARESTHVLREICENTLGLLFIIILLAAASILEPVIAKIPKFNVMTLILLFSFILSLFIMFDITYSIYKLVIHLKDLLAPADNRKLNLSQNETYLVEAYRFLDDNHKKELESLIRTISLKQQIDSEKQQKQDNGTL